MTKDEIKQDLLQVCKVKGWDSDINIVGFHVLCDKLKELGEAEEREACAKLIETSDLGGLSSDPKLQNFIAALLFGYAQAIRARGQK